MVGGQWLLLLSSVVSASGQFIDVARGDKQGDQSALLTFRASTSSSEQEHATFASWAEDSDVCDATGWNSRSAGWQQVMCSCSRSSECRVVYVNLYDVGAGGNLDELAPLTELRVLSLKPSSTITGSLDSLSGMTHLRHLDLHGTAVHGPLSALFGLVQLGESWIAPDGLPYDQGALFLADTHVYGAAGPLRRALPALSEWGPASDSFDYTPCSRIGHPGLNTCSGLGLSMVTDASEYAGVDECACCVGSSKHRDSATGACASAAPDDTLKPESEPELEPAVDSSPAVVSDLAQIGRAHV